MKKLVSLLLAVIMVLSVFVVMPISAGAADTNTVYLINSANWSDVHAYAWNNSVFSENAAWPGQAMQSAGTHSSGAQMYSITFPSAYEKIIFNGSGNQTADLDYQGGMGYDNGSGQWVTVDNPTPGPTPTPGGQMTIYFQNNWMWSDVKVYYWGSSSSNSAEWPGDTPQLAGNDGTYDVYSATVPTDITGIIFNGFDSGINALNQTPDIEGAADGDCYYMIWNNKNEVGKDSISNILPNIGPVTPTTPTPSGVYVVAGDSALCGSEWDPADTSNQMTMTSGGNYEKVYNNVAAGTYQFKVVQGTTWGVEYNLEGLAVGEESNAYVTVDNEGSTVTVGFDGTKAYVNVTGGSPVLPTTPVPTDPVPTTPQPTDPIPTTPAPTDPVEPGKVYVKADGVQYEVKKGELFTYIFNVACSEKVAAIDVETNYNGKGLEFVPDVDEYGDLAMTTMFPVLQNVICNFAIENVLLYNYSSATGLRLPVPADGKYTDNNKVFVGKFKVTADSGVYEINSKIKTMGDGNANRIIFDYEQVNNAITVTQKNEIVGGSVIVDPTTPTPTTPTPTTPQPTTPQPTTPTPTTPSGDIDPNKVYVKTDGNYYEVNKGDKVTYNYRISVDSTKKIGSLDATTFYDTKGLKFIPAVDEYGDVSVITNFPKLTGVVYNFDLEGKLLYNYSNVTGVRMANNSVVFNGTFEVTASTGVYEINSVMTTLADTDLNKIVYKNEKVGEYTYDQILVGLTPIKPSVDPTTPTPTTPQPTTPQPTTPDVEKTYVVADGVKYEVKQGQEFTYTYYLSYKNKIGSLDINVDYDADGLQYIDTTDEYGDSDLNTMFPVLKSVIYNPSTDGLVLYNYSNISGVRFPVPADGVMIDKNIAFVGKFKVTGGPGTYEINSKIRTLADTDMNVLFYEFEKTEGAEVGIYSELDVPEIPDDVMYGDVNNDGKINIFDVSHIQKNVAGYDGYELDERSFKAADVNFDGKINIFDASRIQKYIAGYFVSFV